MKQDTKIFFPPEEWEELRCAKNPQYYKNFNARRIHERVLGVPITKFWKKAIHQ